ncbi:cytochrome P450 6k1-like isoform X2 [Monomorium pharaonis]|uniref:cytochrome P450 6k1-like isoform X2 n=1 Tax=Monomorium pharaonis TaxID=307658 RepID=UPI0017465A56|nr:cytochrome P450 6k1-like isoform X2 [Monomorium pharaonis]
MALITAYWGLDSIIVLTTLVVTVYLYMTRKYNYWKKRGVFELPPTPIFGNFSDIMFMKKNPGYFMKDLYDQRKGMSYIGLYLLDKPCLMVCDRELVKNILIKDFNYFADRHTSPDTKDRLGYANLFFIKNPAWKTLRAKLTPTFTSGKLKKMFELMLECGKNLDTHLNSLKLEEFEGDDLVAQAAIFFTAGYETSSTVMAFSLYELAIHSEIQNRLRREILDALHETDGKITYDMVCSLQYLDMVVSETLRMYPPLPFLDRLTVETYKMPNSDLVLEKGTPVYISMLGIHYDPEYFSDPEKYDPERFSEENKRNIPSCAYIPFGGGPRICIGARMGLLQTKLGIITILSKYEVTPCEKTLIPMVLDPKAALTMPLGGGLHLNIRELH